MLHAHNKELCRCITDNEEATCGCMWRAGVGKAKSSTEQAPTSYSPKRALEGLGVRTQRGKTAGNEPPGAKGGAGAGPGTALKAALK